MVKKAEWIEIRNRIYSIKICIWYILVRIAQRKNENADKKIYIFLIFFSLKNFFINYREQSNCLIGYFFHGLFV